MEKCNCYREYMSVGFDTGRARCFGTRECDPCTCGGDESKCNFYPEKRENANKNQNETEVCTKQEKRKLTKAQAEKEFDIEIID